MTSHQLTKYMINRILKARAMMKIQLFHRKIKAKKSKGKPTIDSLGKLKFIKLRSGNEMKKVKEEYLKCRRRLKAIDTLAAGIAIVNGAISYLEVILHSLIFKNEYFRNEVVENGVIVKD